jgi:hypothetical protein
MQKIEGVQTARVSLKEGLTILDLKPDNRVRLSRLREVIKNNGFVSRDAVIVGSGTVISNAGAAEFEVAGTGERLRLAGQPVKDQQGLWRFTSPAK